MRKNLLVLLALLGVVVGSGCAETTPPATASDDGDDATLTESSTRDAKAAFVGTWELVRVERVGADGELLPPPEPPAFGSTGALGYLMYDASGYMGVTIMQPERQPYAGDQPTPEEAVATLRSYLSYFGTFSVNDAEGYLTHHLQGNVRPPGSTANNKRVYGLSGNQLILMPPVGDSGVQLRVVWQRVPDLPEAELTATHKRLFGFHRIGKIERRTMDGEPVPADQFENAVIIYMPSGHMAVHIVRPNRPVYTGTPTPEQALGALTTYASYFGPFSVHEEEGFVVHHRIGNLNPGQAGTDAKRHFELTDTTLTLEPPPRMIDGRELQTALTWERLN